MIPYAIIDCDLESLRKLRDENLCKDGKSIKKFKIELNETNVVELIKDVEKKIRQAKKVK